MSLDQHEFSQGIDHWVLPQCVRVRNDRADNEWDDRHNALISDYPWFELSHDRYYEAGLKGSIDEFIVVKLSDSSNDAKQRVRTESIRAEFEALSKKWQRETKYLSLISKVVVHPAYLRIIGMGEPAIQLVLESLRDKPAHWFVALQAMSGASPCTISASPSEARIEWLEWGKSQGYIK